jgi:hypothetical protein
MTFFDFAEFADWHPQANPPAGCHGAETPPLGSRPLNNII